MGKKTYRAVEIKNYKNGWDARYVIIDTNTGEVLDDAQGYGYKTSAKAYAAYGYKTRDRNKDVQKKENIRKIRIWMKENKDFMSLLDAYAFDIAKGSVGPDVKIDAKTVKRLFIENDISTDFTPGEFVKVWRKYH